MPGRRAFLASLFAAGMCPKATWADAGNPDYLAAAKVPSGAFALVGLSGDGSAAFEIPLPARGHAAAAHPQAPLAVAFARRPGTFALVIDCLAGRVDAELTAAPGHHFSGHGAYSADGETLYTAENFYDEGRGVVGIWDVGSGYRRIGAFSSEGVGPHEMLRLPDDTLLVANGGIETHPETGRAKLNLPIMRPSLAYFDRDGSLLDQVEPPRAWHRASMRHIAARADGLVAVGCQWQGDLADTPPLLATHRRGGPLHFSTAGGDLWRDMQGYVGSVAFSGAGDEIALTGPRGGFIAIAADDDSAIRVYQAQDVSGAASRGDGFLLTTGGGAMLSIDHGAPNVVTRGRKVWDNHLVRI
ncbi:MAG: DUF1513 domain-containing protein [Pseudomonadota bacterium]